VALCFPRALQDLAEFAWAFRCAVAFGVRWGAKRSTALSPFGRDEDEEEDEEEGTGKAAPWGARTPRPGGVCVGLPLCGSFWSASGRAKRRRRPLAPSPMGRKRFGRDEDDNTVDPDGAIPNSPVSRVSSGYQKRRGALLPAALYDGLWRSIGPGALAVLNSHPTIPAFSLEPNLAVP
jgi:hypothetical protein